MSLTWDTCPIFFKDFFSLILTSLPSPINSLSSGSTSVSVHTVIVSSPLRISRLTKKVCLKSWESNSQINSISQGTSEIPQRISFSAISFLVSTLIDSTIKLQITIWRSTSLRHWESIMITMLLWVLSCSRMLWNTSAVLLVLFFLLQVMPSLLVLVVQASSLSQSSLLSSWATPLSQSPFQLPIQWVIFEVIFKPCTKNVVLEKKEFCSYSQKDKSQMSVSLSTLTIYCLLVKSLSSTLLTKRK